MPYGRCPNILHKGNQASLENAIQIARLIIWMTIEETIALIVEMEWNKKEVSI